MKSKKFMIYSFILLSIFTITVSENISSGSAIFAQPEPNDGLIYEIMDPIDIENTTIYSMFLVTENPENEQFVILFNFSLLFDVQEGYNLNYAVSLSLICSYENVTYIWTKNWNKTTIVDLQLNVTESFSFLTPKKLDKVDVILRTNTTTPTTPNLIHAVFNERNEYKMESYFTENSIDYYNTVFVFYDDWTYNFYFHTIWNNHSIPLVDQNVLITIEQAGTPSLLDDFSMNITLGYLNFENANDIENTSIISDCLYSWTMQENSQCSISFDVDSIPETFQASIADLQIRSGFVFYFDNDEITLFVPLTNEPNFLPFTLHPFLYVGIGIGITLLVIVSPSIYRSIKQRK